MEMAAMPPAWVAVLKEGQDILETAQEKLEALQRAQKKRMLDVFSNDRDREVEDMSRSSLIRNLRLTVGLGSQ